MNCGSYDYSNAGTFLQCGSDILDVKENGKKVLYNVPDPALVREFTKRDANTEKAESHTTETYIIELGSEDPESQPDPIIEIDRKSSSETKTTTKKKCCSSKSLVVMSLLLASCLVVLVVAFIFRSQREEQYSAAILTGNHTLVTDSSASNEEETSSIRDFSVQDQGESTAEGLLRAREVCHENDECESGLCRGTVPPYACEPKMLACHLCNENRNCLSGRCVRRSGKSICAATGDGKMGLGCFCDVDDDCASQRCEGEYLMYTCRPPTSSCSVDSECSSGGVCNSGQCSDGEMGSLGQRQPTGDSCSGHEDCSSRICVGFSSEQDGECSEGQIGSICGSNIDCISQRCIQGVCQMKQASGGPCNGNVECASGICFGFSPLNSGLCLSSENACHNEGEPCGRSGTCVGGLCKDFLLATGSVCRESSDCTSGRCSWSPNHAGKRCE